MDDNLRRRNGGDIWNGRAAGSEDAGGDEWQQLAAAVVKLAIKDYRRGKVCDGRCDKGRLVGVHICQQDAEKFLEGEWGGDLLDLLGYDPEIVRETLALNGHKS